MRSPINPKTRSPINQKTRSPIHPKTRSPIHPKTRSPIHPKTRSPTHKKPDRPPTKNPIAHQSINPKTPAVENRGYTNKTRLRGLKISPDDFASGNTLFVRGGGHRLCRRGFQPPGFFRNTSLQPTDSGKNPVSWIIARR